VTVIVRTELSPAVVNVAAAEPSAPVFAPAALTPPEDAVNVTGTPETRTLFASRAYAVMVAEAEPSEGNAGNHAQLRRNSRAAARGRCRRRLKGVVAAAAHEGETTHNHR
jgi:hypothetical protein